MPSQQTFFALSAPPIPKKMVFAHYMVCCGFRGSNGGVAAAEEEIIMAQTMGINGFALNVGAWLNSTDGPTYRANVANMFAAAAALNSGFTLFFSADMTGLGYDDVVSMMTTYANKPHYFKYNGEPVLSTYSGEQDINSTYTTPSAWWTNLVLAPLRAKGINCFFVPGFGNVGSWFDSINPPYVTQYVARQVAYWGNLVQGLLTWQTLSVVNNNAGNAIAVPIIDAYASSLSHAGKIYMPGIVTKYWGSMQSSNGNIYYEWRGGEGMDTQWRAAISANVPWVEILTWNDFNESYMMPMDDIEKYNDWGFPVGFTKSSLGYAELLRYYIAWFRTGVQPLITRDAVFWFYRTHPALAVGTFRDLPALGGRITGPVRRYVPSADGSGKIPSDVDLLFVTVFAKSSANLSINSTTESIVTGINQFAVPFSAGPAPAFRLWRNQATLISGTGSDTIQSHPVYYDWWNSSGFMEGR
jgi:glucan endo-1,3-alpha-glucosidase